MLKTPPASFSHRSDPQRAPMVRLGPSLAAALLNGLFEHPSEVFFIVPHVRTIEVLVYLNSFFAAYLAWYLQQMSATALHPTGLSVREGHTTPIRIVLGVCHAFHFVNRFAGPPPSPTILRICGDSSACLTDCRHFVNMPETRHLDATCFRKTGHE